MSNDTKPLKVMPRNTYLYEIENYQFSGNGETVVDKAGFNTKSLAKFAEGEKLVKICYESLTKAKGKLSEIQTSLGKLEEI